MTDRPTHGPEGASIPPRRVSLHVLLVLLVCGLVYWPRLGADGFTDSEGHRVVPAWEMRESGQWLVPHLFGQAYLRKPPGIQWAIAGSAAVLGESEFSARAVSALASTAGALLAYAFAARWFGARWALGAGLAHALTPWFWSSGRSAEIEALHNLFVQGAVLAAIDLGIGGREPERLNDGETKRPRAGWWAAVVVAAGVFGAGMTKGPAGAAYVLAAPAAAGIAARRARGALAPLPAIAAGAAGAAWLWAAIESRARAGAPVTQGVSEFLWAEFSHGAVGRALALLPAACTAAMPVSLAMLFPFGRDARAEAAAPRDRRARHAAAALGWTFVLGTLALTALGVTNVRYALPGAACLAPGAAYALRGLHGAFGPARRRIARAMALGRPWAWAPVLLAAAAAWVWGVEPRRDGRSGREAGMSLGAAAAQVGGREPVRVVADHLIEARPEVLLYARRAARNAGVALEVRWLPGLSGGADGAPGTGLLALRTDGSPSEWALYSRRAGAVPLGEWSVHIFSFGLFRAADPGP